MPAELVSITTEKSSEDVDLSHSQVDQRGAVAGGKMVGRDDNSIQIIQSDNLQVRELVARLSEEIEADQQRLELIEGLQFFNDSNDHDGVIGLKAKLEKCGRPDKYLIAIKQKEMFAKFLSNYSLFGAAQELLSLCLHRIHNEFESKVHPACGETPPQLLETLIMDEIISKVVREYGFGAFSLNHGLVMGMTYWLADRCYVRWHR